MNDKTDRPLPTVSSVRGKRTEEHVTVTGTTRRLIGVLDRLPTEEDRSKVVSALASLYLNSTVRQA